MKAGEARRRQTRRELLTAALISLGALGLFIAMIASLAAIVNVEHERGIIQLARFDLVCSVEDDGSIIVLFALASNADSVFVTDVEARGSSQSRLTEFAWLTTDGLRATDGSGDLVLQDYSSQAFQRGASNLSDLAVRIEGADLSEVSAIRIHWSGGEPLYYQDIPITVTPDGCIGSESPPDRTDDSVEGRP